MQIGLYFLLLSSLVGSQTESETSKVSCFKLIKPSLSTRAVGPSPGKWNLVPKGLSPTTTGNMLDLYPSIRRQLLTNLTLAGIVLCILTGFSVTFIEFHRVDQHVANIAIRQSQKLANKYIAFHNDHTSSSYILLQQAIRDDLDHDVFISIEFLDENLHMVANEVIRNISPPPIGLMNKFKQFEMKEKIEHQVVIYDGQIYIKVMVPIKVSKQQKPIGHFQGVYHLQDDQMTAIKQQSYDAIILSLLVTIFTTLFIYPVVSALYKKLLQRSGEVIVANIELLKSLGSAIAQRDSDTNLHNYRVTYISVKIAEQMEISPLSLRSLIKGAFLHDVGKIGISDAILLKPGKLTREEFEMMKKHVLIGADIIHSSTWLHDALDVIVYHHERYDGTGYPSGFKGEEIPLAARIFAIADVFDALVSHRPYKQPFTFTETMNILNESSGSHFDPVILRVFKNIAANLSAEVYVEGSEKQLNDQLDKVLNKYFTSNL